MKSRKNGTRRRQPGRGALVTIAALLLGSALLRLGGDAGQGFARAAGDIAVSELNKAAALPKCEAPRELAPTLAAFQAREERLKKREAAMKDRMKALDIANQELDEKLVALTLAEEELRATIALADSAAEDDLTRLTRVYETMKPKQAAALFEEMNPDFAAGFLGRMNPDAAAAIMAGLSPEVANTFSVVLAGRNAGVPSE